jgi:predicted DNA-binding transcriptional regulator AlpA
MSTRALGGRRILAAAGPTVSVPDAAQVLGISRAHAYALAKRGELGVRVLRLGNRFVVPTAELRREVGLEADPAATRRSGDQPPQRAGH